MRIGRQLELLLQQGIVYPAFRQFLRNKPIQLPLVASRFRRILVIRNDRLGDMIATSPVLRLLRRHLPHATVGVAASEANAGLIRTNPHVDRIHTLERNPGRILSGIREIRRERYDLVLNFIFNRMTESGWLANLCAPGAVKIGAGDERYRPLFNVLVPLERYRKHMALVLLEYVSKVFGLPLRPEDEELELFIDAPSMARARGFLARYGLLNEVGGEMLPFVVLNGSAPDEMRRFSDEQLKGLIRHLAGLPERRTVVIAAPADRDRIRELVSSSKTTSCVQFPEEGSASLLEIAALIGFSAGVVTPDTSIVHVASATKTPVLACYATSAPVEEWLPFRVPHRTLIAKTGEPVSSLSVDRLAQAVDAFLSECPRSTEES